MSEAKFTKGKRHITEMRLENKIIIETDSRVIADISDPCMDEDIANAHLISAAPDMYDELKAIRDIFEAHDAEVFKDSIECLDNVLARARGEENE